MISNIFLSRSQSQCLLQAGLPLTEHSSLDVENTEVVLALHVARLYLQDPDKSHKLVSNKYVSSANISSSYLPPIAGFCPV